MIQQLNPRTIARQLLASFLALLLVRSTGSPRRETNPGKRSTGRQLPNIDDLINTKLDVKFDYDKSYMYGKEWVTLKPHFYPTDTLSPGCKRNGYP